MIAASPILTVGRVAGQPSLVWASRLAGHEKSSGLLSGSSAMTTYLQGLLIDFGKSRANAPGQLGALSASLRYPSALLIGFCILPRITIDNGCRRIGRISVCPQVGAPLFASVPEVVHRSSPKHRLPRTKSPIPMPSFGRDPLQELPPVISEGESVLVRIALMHWPRYGAYVDGQLINVVDCRSPSNYFGSPKRPASS
jgi:hypothetical protein